MTRLHEIVLQYNVLYCGWKGVQEAKLYRNTKLYCDRRLGDGLGVAASAGVHGHDAGVHGALACFTGAQQAQAALARGAGPVGSAAGGARQHGVRAQACEASRSVADSRGKGAAAERRARGALRRRAAGVRAGTAWAHSWAARARGLCAQAGPVGWSCTRLGFQPGFFDSVFFLSHQMNTVHCKINFEKTNILNLIKIKSNQIKFDKIFEK